MAHANSPTGRGARLEEAWGAILARVNDDPDEWDRTVRRLFERIDRDGSGEIDAHELGEAIRVLGVQVRKKHERRACLLGSQS